MLIWKKIVEGGQGSETNLHTAGLNPPVLGDLIGQITWDIGRESEQAFHPCLPWYGRP